MINENPSKKEILNETLDESSNNKPLLLKNSLSLIQKICLAGLFIAIIIILEKVVSISVPAMPFVRISFGGSGLIMFSSYLLGPYFGLLIGAASDILGYFIFDHSGFGYFPLLTLTPALIGFIGYFMFSFSRKITNKNIIRLIEYGLFFICYIAVLLFFIFNDSMALFGKTYQLTKTIKIISLVILFTLFIGVVVMCELIDKYSKFAKKNVLNVHQISFSCFAIEILIIVLFGTIMKGIVFGFQTYLFILITQIMTSFVNICLNTLILCYIMFATRRYVY